MGNESTPLYKKTYRTVWSVRGRESKGELVTKETYLNSDNQGRAASNVNLVWNTKKHKEILTAVEALNDLMTENTYALAY